MEPKLGLVVNRATPLGGLAAGNKARFSSLNWEMSERYVAPGRGRCMYLCMNLCMRGPSKRRGLAAGCCVELVFLQLDNDL